VVSGVLKQGPGEPDVVVVEPGRVGQAGWPSSSRSHRLSNLSTAVAGLVVREGSRP
jgi:hypothetical protein